MRKVYMTPAVEVMKMEGMTMYAASPTGVNSADFDGFGGNASAAGVDQADVNRGGDWDIW